MPSSAVGLWSLKSTFVGAFLFAAHGLSSIPSAVASPHRGLHVVKERRSVRTDVTKKKATIVAFVHS